MKKLNAQPLGKSSSVKPYVADADGLGGVHFAHLVSLFQQKIGNSGLAKITHLKSSLVGGVGFVNLYEVDYGDVDDLSQLKLSSLKGFKAGDLSTDLVERLNEYLGDIKEVLYLLEYPDGFILSLNNQMLSLKPQWP